MIHHLSPVMGPDWWELTDEDRQLWLAQGPKAFLQDRRADYLIEASAIKSRGTTSANARKKARLVRLADEIRFSVENETYIAEDKQIGIRWVLYIRLRAT